MIKNLKITGKSRLYSGKDVYVVRTEPNWKNNFLRTMSSFDDKTFTDKKGVIKYLNKKKVVYDAKDKKYYSKELDKKGKPKYVFPVAQVDIDYINRAGND